MKLAWAVVLASMVASAAGAQEVPAEEPAAAPDRWGFELNLALTSTSGNDQISVFVTDGKITHLQTDALKLDWTGRIRYGRSEGQDVAQNMQSSLTVELAPRARWSPFVVGQAEKDPFKKLDLRTSSGAGVRYQVLRRNHAELTLSGAALHSYENLQVQAADPVTRELTHNARWRWIGEGSYAVGETVEAENRTYYEPVWDHGSDYLMEVQNTVRFRVNDHLSFRVAHVFQRDSTPPAEVNENNSMLTLGVGFKTRF
jgi:putative salt-induced outer membrane protein YdiY